MNDMRYLIEQNEEVLRRVAALNHEELKNELKDEEEFPIKGEGPVTRHVLSTQVKKVGIEQQHGNIFHTLYHVNNNVCSLIIDGGSCANIASALLVEKL